MKLHNRIKITFTSVAAGIDLRCTFIILNVALPLLFCKAGEFLPYFPNFSAAELDKKAEELQGQSIWVSAHWIRAFAFGGEGNDSSEGGDDKKEFTRHDGVREEAFERQKKVRERGFRRRDRERPWKRGDRGEMEERRKSVPFCRKVSAFVDADISKARTTKGDVSWKGSTSGYTRHDKAWWLVSGSAMQGGRRCIGGSLCRWDEPLLKMLLVHQTGQRTGRWTSRYRAGEFSVLLLQRRGCSGKNYGRQIIEKEKQLKHFHAT